MIGSKLFRDITTGKDNQTHDVVRVSMAVIVSTLPVVLVWALVMQTISFYTGRPFDIDKVFNAILAFCGGAGAFLMTGSASLLIKKTTEPDGTRVEETEITKGAEDGKEVTNMTNTISNPVNRPENAP